jgi:hypothetical protein
MHILGLERIDNKNASVAGVIHRRSRRVASTGAGRATRCMSVQAGSWAEADA